MFRHRFVFILLLLKALSAQAETADALWRKNYAYMQANKGLVADELNCQFSFSGDAPEHGAYKTRIGGWKDGEPVRILFEPTEENKKAFKANDLDFHVAARFADHPEDLLKSANSISLAGKQILNGRDWSILQVSSPGGQGHAAYRAKVWVDPATGAPLKIEGHIENLPLPGARTARFSVLYEEDSNKRSLPKEVSVEYSLSLLFHKADVLFKESLSTWLVKP